MFGETESKYLAGLFDADASLSFVNNNGYLGLTLQISMSESIDRKGKYCKYLGSKVGKLYHRKREDTWAVQNELHICARNELESILPLIIKHMVIKGKKWMFMLETFRNSKAIKVTDDEVTSLRILAEVYGPVKPKNHPSWAWVAGYLDGDGWYLKRERKHQVEMHVGAVSCIEQMCGLELLHKAFGGVLKYDRGHMRWIKNLGPRDKNFALYFLGKMVKHSHLKKWKIEQLISTYSQRLSVSTSTEGAIV